MKLAEAATINNINQEGIFRGQIYIANLGETIGCEQSGERPVLVVQNNKGYKSPTITVTSITSSTKKLQKYCPYHTNIIVTDDRAKFSGLYKKDSVVLCEQIRTISRKRFKKFVGELPDSDMKRIDKALIVALGLYK
jgi:mRNA interferase MazF